MIEISGVSEHLLTECESSDKFAQCPRCKEAIPKEDLDEHFAEKSCQGKYLQSTPDNSNLQVESKKFRVNRELEENSRK